MSTQPNPTTSAPTADRTHHPYSPSTLQSLEACPCYQSRQDVVHERTIIGTIAHNAAEKGEDDNRLDDDDAAAVAECLDFYEKRRRMAFDAREAAVEATRKQTGCTTQEAQAHTPYVRELKETYLPVDEVSWEETVTSFTTGEKLTRKVQATTAGYIDSAIIMHDGTYAEIFDWKFGMWSVEQADNNLQGISYALGMLKDYASLEQVRFWFKQPHTGGLESSVVGRKDIAKLYLRIQIIVEKAKKARASGNFDMARPMVPNCNFCANIGACTKVAEFACKVGHKFHPLAIPSDITPSKIHNPNDQKIGIELAGVMATWSKAFRSQQTDRVIRGVSPVPDGYKIQQKSDREIVDPAKYKEMSLRFMTPAEYEATLTPAFGKVEDIIKDKAPRGEKSAAIDAFKQALLDSGAVKIGQPYSFLKAVNNKENKPNT